MDGGSMTFTSLTVIVLLLIMLVMFACHYLGPRATTWMRSNKEEKIGLSKNKLFHANGYIIHSGSEFLLSSSGSFKRFDTIDKDAHNQSGQQQQQRQPQPQPTGQTTTPLWNLPQVDCTIPPQPLRPAPAPKTPGKVVTFSFSQLNEISPTAKLAETESAETVESGQFSAHSSIGHTNSASLVSCLRFPAKTAHIPQPIEAPPPPRMSSSVMMSSTAIPRPVAKRQEHLQNATNGATQLIKENTPNETTTITATATATTTTMTSTTTTATDGTSHPKILKRRNSSTNPFLCETIENLPQNADSNMKANLEANANNSNNIKSHPLLVTTADIEKCIASSNGASTNNGNGNGNGNGNNHNPFYPDTAINTPSPDDLNLLVLTDEDDSGSELRYSLPNSNRLANTNGHRTKTFNFPTPPVAPLAGEHILQSQQFRNRSFSETEATSESNLKTYSSKIATAGLLKLTSTTNPFTGLTKKVKGPHLLQKTISEDYLFRKLGVTGGGSVNGSGTAAGGNATWSFGRSFMRQDSVFSLGRRNSSQCSLDSTGGSINGINLERAISCDSVNSDSSVFLCDLDQPYTQITGYLCVGLQYDKNSITEDGMDLTVSVLEAKGLICHFNVESLDTFVRIYLVPDQAGAMQTKVFKNSETPSYNESFSFWLKKAQGRHSLWFHLYHNGSAHTLLGEAEMEIGEMPRPITTWIPLSDSRKCNAQWGELMFSLSYLPTAERLTIVVVKARSLKLPVEIQNVFVKVYLLNNEKKVLKKRTSLKRNDRCPIFNESMIFSVPPQSLTTAQLRLTVFGVSDSTTVTPLGHVIAGSCSTGKGLRHWHQMLSSLRKPVAMWHVLRRASNQPIFTGGAEAVVAAMQSTALRAKRNSIV